MRKYEILDKDGNVIGYQEMDDSLAPVLLTGQSSRLVGVDGHELSKKTQPLVKQPDTPATVEEDLITKDEEAEQRRKAREAKAAAAKEE